MSTQTRPEPKLQRIQNKTILYLLAASKVPVKLRILDVVFLERDVKLKLKLKLRKWLASNDSGHLITKLINPANPIETLASALGRSFAVRPANVDSFFSDVYHVDVIKNRQWETQKNGRALRSTTPNGTSCLFSSSSLWLKG